MNDRVSMAVYDMFMRENFKEITMHDLLNNFDKSGSRVFGGSTEDSDYDFLVNPAFNRIGFAICRYFRADREDYYDDNIYSYSFLIKDGSRINLIFFKEKRNYSAWCFATTNLKRLFKSGTPNLKMMIGNKKTRCDLFQYFVGMFREFEEAKTIFTLIKRIGEGNE